MLNNSAVKAAAAQTRAYKMSDAGGLYLFVTPAGCKSWRLKYRLAGKERLLVIGRHPDVSLADARRRRDEVKQDLREGRDPSARSGEADSFELLARGWYQHNQASWSPAHAIDVLAGLERDILPAIGQRSSGAITAPELLDLLHKIEARGRVETARRQRQRLSSIFEFGIARGLIDRDPAAHLGRAMRSAPPARPQPALIDVQACRALLSACDRDQAQPATLLASQFLALTAVRLGAVRGMLWSEIEDIDGAALWRVPAERMKLKRAKKSDRRFDHLVPLSSQAVAVLRQAAAEFGYDTRSPGAGTLVFPGRDRGRPIGEGVIGALYDRAGFAGRHVPHGWRSSFSTILNETMGPDYRADIDRALAHSPKDKVEAAYNRAALLTRRRTLMERWGELLTKESHLHEG